MPDFTHIDEALRAAKGALGEAMEHAARDLARFERENRPTEEERRALQEAALRGELGDNMRELARRIDRGEDDWDAVFSGASPNAELLQDHVTRMAEANRDAIRQAFEDDEDFDPSQPPRDA